MTGSYDEFSMLECVPGDPRVLHSLGGAVTVEHVWVAELLQEVPGQTTLHFRLEGVLAALYRETPGRVEHFADETIGLLLALVEGVLSGKQNVHDDSGRPDVYAFPVALPLNLFWSHVAAGAATFARVPV